MFIGYGVDDLENGKILVYFDSRTDHKQIKEYNIKIPPVPNKTVRVDVHIGGFYLEKITDELTKIICCWNLDPKLIIPKSIINWFTGAFAGTLLSQIVKASYFDENSEHAKRIKNNDYFYGDMQRRLNKMNKKPNQSNTNNESKTNNNDMNNNNNINNNSNTPTTKNNIIIKKDNKNTNKTTAVNVISESLNINKIYLNKSNTNNDIKSNNND